MEAVVFMLLCRVTNLGETWTHSVTTSLEGRLCLESRVVRAKLGQSVVTGSLEDCMFRISMRFAVPTCSMHNCLPSILSYDLGHRYVS